MATINGSPRNDSIEGGDSADLIRGFDGNDRLEGEDGSDSLFGGNGNDSLDGDDGHDRLWGDAGNDRLDGGDGNDRLFGGAGNDRIEGDDGRDVLSGGLGADRFVFEEDFDTDTILDFNRAQGDRIVLEDVPLGRSFGSLDSNGDGRITAADQRADVVNGDLVIGFGDDDRLIVQDVVSLQRSDFVFVLDS